MGRSSWCGSAWRRSPGDNDKAWWSITTLSQAELIPLVCADCGSRLGAAAEAAAFLCPCCGLAHEPVHGRLRPLRPFVAAITSRGALPASLSYLAVWELMVTSVDSQERRLFVPAFSLARAVVERLGIRLAQKQPSLEPAPAGCGDPGALSQVVLGRDDARALSRFVLVALQIATQGPEGAVAYDDLQLQVCAERLVYLPAVWDPRCIYDANWRVLLCEFDDPGAL